MLDVLTHNEWEAVALTLEVATRAVLFGLPLAVLTALVLARGRFFGRAGLDALVHLPMVLPPVVVGWLLLLVFGVRGPVGALLRDWFGVRLVFTSTGAALACAVMAFPLMVRAVRLSLEGVDRGLEQAARRVTICRLLIRPRRPLPAQPPATPSLLCTPLLCRRGHRRTQHCAPWTGPWFALGHGSEPWLFHGGHRTSRQGIARY